MPYECFACKQVLAIEVQNQKCPSCGSTNGQVISVERMKEGLERGVYFNRDPRTGKPSKPKRR